MQDRSYLDTVEMRRIKRIHFVGIGGSGMSGIAEVLHNQGYVISGSDIITSGVTERLVNIGINVCIGHSAKNIADVDVVVVSSAIDPKNQEIAAALEERIPVIPRAEMLGELMRYRHGIAVAGTHGKTTTTSLIVSILSQARLDPTFVIGGLLNSAESNAKLGASRYIVAEADESDASFLYLQPMVVVLTNIDRDHLNNYFGSLQKLKEAFLAVVHNLPFYGFVLACIDDPGVRSIIPDIKRPVLTYGFDSDADVKAYGYIQHVAKSTFFVRSPSKKESLKVDLALPGRHNALNALAAIALAMDENVPNRDIVNGLASFQGVERRFEMHGTFSLGKGTVLLIDDYGHHPTEVKETIKAVRDGWSESRLVMVYQPHRYTRTFELFDQFIEVLSEVDYLILVDVYPAGETCIAGATSEDLYDKLNQRIQVDHVSEMKDVFDHLEDVLRAGDLLLTQGAGATAQLAAELKMNWAERRVTA